jgi:hypothetical protein
MRPGGRDIEARPVSASAFETSVCQRAERAPAAGFSASGQAAFGFAGKLPKD